MNIIVVGINHKTAPVYIRERVAFPKDKIGESLECLCRLHEIEENVILSTCNRVEIYARTRDIANGIAEIKRFICDYHNIPYEELERYCYVYSKEEAVQHLFKVSSSLDSMVIGEPQILGQVKEAYVLAKSLRVTGVILNQLFEKAFSVAKKVRSRTRIAENAVSISFAAVELAKKIFGDITGKTVMLIGTGEMSELAARHLISNGVRTILVSNRTFDRAVDMAKELKGSAIRFENFEEELIRTDIVISSTAAPHFIIKKKTMEKIIHLRKNRPIFFIDIAVPRDIDPAVNEIENVYLYNIDDLQNVITTNIMEREKEGVRAGEIIKKETLQFINWFNSLEMVPTITLLREKIENIRITEMEKTFSKWKDLSEEERIAIDNLTSAIVNKILHNPTVNLKNQVKSKDKQWYVEVIRYLFNLDGNLD
jgi:glutamyl-tRNA reductase